MVQEQSVNRVVGYLCLQSAEHLLMQILPFYVFEKKKDIYLLVFGDLRIAVLICKV